MTTLAIELHDAGILVGREDGSVIEAGPGYAVLDGEAVLTGNEALQVARLKPRRVNNRFWSELDNEPLPHPFPRGVTHADLAYTQLSRTWSMAGGRADEVLISVPSIYTEAQLGLLLGIARSCGIPVRGFVDTALAAVYGDSVAPVLLHLDVQLHRVVLTELHRERELVRGRVEISERTGLASLQEVWARRLAELFVRQTRFDPLHVAETEQEFYRRLPRWIAGLHESQNIDVTMESGSREYPLELTREQLVSAASVDYERIVQLIRRVGPTEQTTLLLSHHAAALPGLARRLSEVAGQDPVRLPSAAALRGALAARERIRGEGEEVPFVARLPAPGPSASVKSPASPSPEPDGRAPTHVVHAGLAHTIGAESLELGLGAAEGSRAPRLRGPTAGISRRHCSLRREGRRVIVEDHSTYGTYLNGERVDGRAELRAGDRLRLGSPGVELQLVALVDDDGAP